MNLLLDAPSRDWLGAPWLAFDLVLAAVIYLRGWRALGRRDPRRWHAGRPAAFLAALAAIALALDSPLERLAPRWLAMHMAQHLLLMMLAAPLFWLSWPLLPLVCGLPRAMRRVWVVPLLRFRPLRLALERLAFPPVAWLCFAAATWFWHAPRFYELALRSPAWHVVEHATFLAAALVFWHPVVRPYPSRPQWSAWLLLPYLLLADVQNTLLAAWLTFAPVVRYPHYAQVPRVADLSPLADQAAAGVLMWVPGSLAFLLPLFWIGVGLMQSRRPRSGGLCFSNVPDRARQAVPCSSN